MFKNEWTVLQKFDSVTLPTLMYVHFNVRLAFVYSSGKCMSHKSRPMLQKNPNMARNSNSRNYYFGKQIVKFSWSWWLLHVTVPNPNQSTQRIVCLDNHVFLGPLKNSERPKPLFWFRSNAENQIGQYFQADRVTDTRTKFQGENPVTN